MPVKWEDGWPVLGENGKVPEDTGIARAAEFKLVASDEFNASGDKIGSYYTELADDAAGDENKPRGSHLGLVWQWNHNPDHTKWSLTERPGYLRLKTGGSSQSIVEARNVLTQRTFGPECSGMVAIDVSGMQEGDYAGLAAFQKNYGFVGVKASNPQNIS